MKVERFGLYHGFTQLPLPLGSTVLGVRVDKLLLFLFVLTTESEGTLTRTFEVRMTNEKLFDDPMYVRKFIGTACTDTGEFHVWELMG